MSNKYVDLDEDIYSDELFDDIHDLENEDLDDEDAEYVNQTAFSEELIDEDEQSEFDYTYDDLEEVIDDEDYQ